LSKNFSKICQNLVQKFGKICQKCSSKICQLFALLLRLSGEEEGEEEEEEEDWWLLDQVATKIGEFAKDENGMKNRLVTKCVTGDFLQLTFNDVGRGGGGGRGGGQKVLSRPLADNFAVGRRQKAQGH
jgi:hypothetical protein